LEFRTAARSFKMISTAGVDVDERQLARAAQ
jgi:hypothetical protein